MKLTKITLALLFSIGTAQAEYQMMINLDGKNIRFTNWTQSSPILGQWQDDGGIYGCSNWSPEPSSITITTPFVQTATDCKQNQIRTVQNRELDTVSGSIKNSGEEYTEQRIVTVNQTRESIGSKENWVEVTPTYTAWTNTNSLYGCTNWTPAGSTKTATATFTQTATNCKTDQTRKRQNREQETTTLTYRNTGTAITENQTVSNQSATRSYTVTLGAWTNSGSKTGCTNWSPATSTVNSGSSFTQTATDCKQAQTRTRVEKYVDHKSGSTVQVSSTSESKTLTNQSSTRTAIGTKLSKYCTYQDYTTSDGTQIHNWYTTGSKSYFFGSAYQTIPYMWIDVATGKTVDIMGSGGTSIAGLSKVSNTEFRYTVGSKTWKITRGSYVKANNGTNYYQLCYE